MDIYLVKGFNSQHALSNMDEYAPYINRTIYGIYSKGDELHTTIHAGHPNGLTLKELVKLTACIEESARSIAEQCEIPFDSSEIEVKLNIHSPGLIELIGALAGAGVILSLFVFSINNLLNGGKLKISLKKDGATNNLNFSVDSESSGILGNQQRGKLIELSEKKQLLEMVNQLDIKTPEIVSAILNGDKITPQMISEAESTKVLYMKSEDSVPKLIESNDNPSPAEDQREK